MSQCLCYGANELAPNANHCTVSLFYPSIVHQSKWPLNTVQLSTGSFLSWPDSGTRQTQHAGPHQLWSPDQERLTRTTCTTIVVDAAAAADGATARKGVQFRAVRQGQITAQSDLDNIIQGCPCLWCSRHGDDPQTVRHTIEYQDPYENQNLGGGHPISVAAAMDSQTQTWSATPQTLVCCQIFCFLYLAEILLYLSRIRTMSDSTSAWCSGPSPGPDWCRAWSGLSPWYTNCQVFLVSC